MKESLKTFYTAFVTSGVVATSAMVYTHNKSLDQNA